MRAADSLPPWRPSDDHRHAVHRVGARGRALEAALDDLRTVAPPRSGSARSSRSAWPTATPPSTPRSARPSSRGTAAVSRGSPPPATRPRSRIGSEAQLAAISHRPARSPPRSGEPSRDVCRAIDGCGSRSTSAATRRSRSRSGPRRSRSRVARSGRTAGSPAEIGRPKAVRAVGTALAHNPVPARRPVPPRRPERRDDRPVLDGRPGNKRRVLASEGLDTRWLEAEAAAGKRFTRLGHDAHRVPPDLPPRPPGHRPPSSLVPEPAGGGGRRLPAVQALPTGGAAAAA